MAEQMALGQRVRVNCQQLVHNGQRGTIVAAGTPDGWYVHLDYDDERPDAHVFFHPEELEIVSINSLPGKHGG